MSPDLCATCNRVIFRHAVACDGPCGLTFHLTCTSLQLEGGGEPSFFDELSWLCEGCRLILQVPPELWVEIFDRLEDAADVLKVREVCRAWKQIVDGSVTLRRRIKVRIKVVINRDFELGEVPCAAGVVIRGVDIVMVNSWWSGIGARLVFLELDGCRVKLEALLGMLGQAPFLKELKLTDVGQRDEEVPNTGVNFQLENLEMLSISTENGFDRKFLLNVLAKSCPRLRYLAVHGISNRKALIRMVQAVQTTLKGIKFDTTDMVLESLSKQDQLQLRHVSILSTIIYDRDYFAKFFRSQQQIVELSICQDALQFLADKEFTRLKLITLKIELYQSSTLIIAPMPTLRNLEVTAYGRPTTRFGRCQTPNLEAFRLFGVRIVGNSLTNFLASCPNLNLLHLAQINTDVSMDLGDLPQTFSHLKTLKLDQSNVPKKLLLDLFVLTPNLQDLELTLICEVDNEVLLGICHNLKVLNRLALECWLHDWEAITIVEWHGPELRRLEWNELWELSEDVKRRLREHFAGGVRFGWRKREMYGQDLMEF